MTSDKIFTVTLLFIIYTLPCFKKIGTRSPVIYFALNAVWIIVSCMIEVNF